MDDGSSKLLALLFWIAGIIMAKGFWSTFFAVIFPLWAYIVVVYNILLQFGFIH